MAEEQFLETFRMKHILSQGHLKVYIESKRKKIEYP
jgi:hypothetical protein